jgi:hypothetical protein
VGLDVLSHHTHRGLCVCVSLSAEKVGKPCVVVLVCGRWSRLRLAIACTPPKPCYRCVCGLHAVPCWLAGLASLQSPLSLVAKFLLRLVSNLSSSLSPFFLSVSWFLIPSHGLSPLRCRLTDRPTHLFFFSFFFFLVSARHTAPDPTHAAAGDR